MAVNEKEGPFQKLVDFFTQRPHDRDYERRGGDDRVPVELRTDDPRDDANKWASSLGEDLPYPGHRPEDAPTFEAEEELTRPPTEPEGGATAAQ